LIKNVQYLQVEFYTKPLSNYLIKKPRQKMYTKFVIHSLNEDKGKFVLLQNDGTLETIITSAPILK